MVSYGNVAANIGYTHSSIVFEMKILQRIFELKKYVNWGIDYTTPKYRNVR